MPAYTAKKSPPEEGILCGTFLVRAGAHLQVGELAEAAPQKRRRGGVSDSPHHASQVCCKTHDRPKKNIAREWRGGGGSKGVYAPRPVDCRLVHKDHFFHRDVKGCVIMWHLVSVWRLRTHPSRAREGWHTGARPVRGRR